MFNETSGEIAGNFETFSSTMTTKHQLLEEQFEKMVTEKIGEMETKSSSTMDDKDQSIKEKLEKFVNEELGEIEEDVEKIKLGLKRDCEWGSWSDWEPCTQNCEGGNQQRKRPLLVPAKFGGQCSGSELEIRIALVSLVQFPLKIPFNRPIQVFSKYFTIFFQQLFQNCVDDWCYQKGTSQQFTKCETASSDGKTCHNPEIRYGTTVGGHPIKDAFNNILQWCQQLFPTSTNGDATYSSSSSLNVGKGALWWGTGYDESGSKWYDSSDGPWKDSTLDGSFSDCNKQTLDYCIMTSVTCQ